MERFKKTNKSTILIDSSRMEQSINYINENDMITTVQLNSWYYKENNLNFVKKCPNIKIINNVDCEIVDFSALYETNNITSLWTDFPSGELDPSRISGLKDLRISWNKKIINIEKCFNLEELSLSNYKPKTKNLDQITYLKNLNELTIVQSNIQSLEGIEGLNSLTTLNLYYLKNLVSLEAICELQSTLEKIEIQNCPNIKSYEALKNLTQLSSLSIDRSSEISNLKFVKQLINLSYIYIGDTDVEDGNLSYLERIKNVEFTEKNNFSHLMKDFNSNK